jgi:hypothetical protein
MKYLIILIGLVFTMESCSEKQADNNNYALLQHRVDSLSTMLAKIKPGLGEMMSTIQLHHEKLWFAGVNSNWKLADFEINEIKEAVAQAAAIETDRPEIKSLPILTPALDSVSKAIGSHNVEQFKYSYGELSATCTYCHKTHYFEFNVIKEPTGTPVTDQEFVPGKN